MYLQYVFCSLLSQESDKMMVLKTLGLLVNLSSDKEVALHLNQHIQIFWYHNKIDLDWWYINSLQQTVVSNSISSHVFRAKYSHWTSKNVCIILLSRQFMQNITTDM